MKDFLKLVRNNRSFAAIISGAAYVVTSRIVASGISLAATFIITRLYGAEELGAFTLITTAISILTVFALAGSGTAILKLIPQHITNHSAASALRLYQKTWKVVAAISICTTAVILPFSPIIAALVFNNPSLSIPVAVSSLFIAAQCLMLLNIQAIRALKLVRTFALLQCLPSVLFCIAVIVMSIPATNPNTSIYAQLFAWAVTALISTTIVSRCFHKKARHSDEIQDVPINALLSTSLPMLMSTFMNTVLSYSGIIMLGIFRSNEEVGHYALAVKLATITSFLVQSINTIAAPTFSQLYSEGGKNHELLRIAQTTTRVIFWLSAPILISLVLAGPHILAQFHSDFVGAYPAMVILAASQFVNAASGSTGYFLNMTGEENTLGKIMFAAAVLVIAINLLATPLIGATGAAIATFISTVCWNTSAQICIIKKFGQSIAYYPFQRRYQHCTP